MSRAHELSWCAGFFDGEGYVSIVERNQKYKDKVYIGHYLRIGINHVNPEPLYFIKKILGGNVVLDKSSLSQAKDGCVRKPRYKWVLTTSAAAEALKQILPYLRNKNRVAEIGLELQSTIQSDKQKVTETTFLYRGLLKAQLRELNSCD